MNNNEVLVNSIDWPLNPKFPFPLDVRQFFSSKEEADAAAAGAVVANVNRDINGNVTGTTIPSEEDGGRETVYYFGEPIVVVNEDRTEGTLYIIVKKKSSDEGMLLEVGTSALENYYTHDETDVRIRQIVAQEIGELDVNTLNGIVYASIEDGCGNTQYLNAIYVKGIKEVNGKIELDDNASVVVAFDSNNPYAEDNPLATVGTVAHLVGNATEEFSIQIENILGLIASTNSHVSANEREINRIKSGETGVFEVNAFDENGNEVGDYWLEDTPLNGLNFQIIPKYDTISTIKILSDSGQTEYYTPTQNKIYPWPDALNSTTHFEIEVGFDGAKKIFTKDITFVKGSIYGVMSETTYETVKNRLSKYYGNQGFKHVYDINGLDYISCYNVFRTSNENDLNIITPTSTSRKAKYARGYNDAFETEAIGGLNINERFYAIVFLPETGYLCYIKDDPCQINKFKQRFEL